MKINPTDSIRQHHLGQFRRPEDGNQPYAHVNSQKLESKEEQYKSTVYVNNNNVVSLEKRIASNSHKIFDSDAGLKASIKKLSKTSRDEKADIGYDKTGKAKITIPNNDARIDEWV